MEVFQAPPRDFMYTCIGHGGLVGDWFAGMGIQSKVW